MGEIFSVEKLRSLGFDFSTSGRQIAVTKTTDPCYKNTSNYIITARRRATKFFLENWKIKVGSSKKGGLMTISDLKNHGFNFEWKKGRIICSLKDKDGNTVHLSVGKSSLVVRKHATEYFLNLNT